MVVSEQALSRRAFIVRAGMATALSTLGMGSVSSRAATETAQCCDIVVFSKIFQELKLDFEAAAAMTAAAGLEGVDCPVRPGGEVLPERVEEDLPRYVAALKRHGLVMPMITTAIISVSSPNAERLLRTARQLGVRHYRLGWEAHAPGKVLKDQIGELRARLQDLAAMSREIGIGAIYQNHSPMGTRKCIGGDLTELKALLDGFDPAQVGAAFDIGHALSVHGDNWKRHFENLRPHLAIAYCKDITAERKWVALGQGKIEQTGYFKVLRRTGYTAPISLHVEYAWCAEGTPKTRETLLTALKADRTMLQRWLVA